MNFVKQATEVKKFISQNSITMQKETSMKLFENKKIRSEWNEEAEEWYFSVVDVIEILTDSVNPTDYLKKLRKRDILLGDYIGTNCPQVVMITETGKKRKLK